MTCAYCGQPMVGEDAHGFHFIARDYDGNEIADWAAGNRAFCDYIHRNAPGRSDAR